MDFIEHDNELLRSLDIIQVRWTNGLHGTFTLKAKTRQTVLNRAVTELVSALCFKFKN